MKEILTISPQLDGCVWHYRHMGQMHQMHHHVELQVNLVIRGWASFVMSDRRYDLRRGTQLWLFPRQEHVLIDKSGDFEMWIAIFRPRMVRRMARRREIRVLREANPTGNFSRQLNPQDLARLSSLFDALAAAEDDPPRFNLGLAYAMFQAWSVHLHSEAVTVGQEVHPAVETAARLIRDEPEPQNIEQLAERCGLSSCHLSRIFKQQTGVALVAYRQRIYLERFLSLYGNGRRTTMLCAALEAGFGSYPQFHRVFKQIMGRSPATYRRDENAEKTGE